jgi:single-stranded-DNA-specific exonuclease
MKYLENACSLSGRVWRLRPSDEMQALAISQRFNLPLVLGNLLTARGISLEKVEAFLNPTLKQFLPDPSTFKDLDIAVERLLRALKEKEKIAVFGDYDVDGATSSAVLYRYLSAVGADIVIYIPDRMREGYGPNALALLTLAEQGVKLVITVDCGTTASEPFEEAKKAGMDVIVIDHHMPDTKLPSVTAVLNPNRFDESGVYGYLAAVGVCFIFLAGLNRALRVQGFFSQKAEPDLLSLLDLVALGTICDVMPLKGLNRAFVTQGLKVMAARCNLGLKTLMDVSGIRDIPSAYHLGFILGPRVNAGGRVGKSDLGATLLTTEHPLQAEQIAHTLNELNQERQNIEQEVLEQAILQAEKQSHPLLICYGMNWHPGVIGIVAGRLKERFNRPSLVISLDENGVGKGSGRSITGIDLGFLIQEAKRQALLLGIEELHNFLNDHINRHQYDLTPCLSIDNHLTLTGASVSLAQLLEILAPYGQGNPSPRFIFENVRILKANVVGKDHIRCLLTDEGGGRLSAISFRSLHSLLGETLLHSKGETLHIVGTLKLDSWQGEERVQLTIDDAMFARTLLRKAG